jgi:hypothetical protein
MLFHYSGWLQYKNCFAVPGSSALHNSHGQPLLPSCHRRRNLKSPRWFDLPKPIAATDLKDTKAFLKSAIFIPFLQFDHFGHLLTETTGWLSPLLMAKTPSPIPTHILLGQLASSSKEQLSSILSWPIGSISSTSDFTEITRIERAWIPVPSMVNRDRILPRHITAVQNLLHRLLQVDLEELATLAKDTKQYEHKFIYLSRSRLPKNLRTIENESLLERYLSARGWMIVHPQELSIEEQLLHLLEADVIAGPLGSAFHLLMALGRYTQGKKVISLGFANELSRPGPGENFGLQFKLQKINNTHLSALEPKISGFKYENQPRDAELVFKVDVLSLALDMTREAQLYCT